MREKPLTIASVSIGATKHKVGDQTVLNKSSRLQHRRLQAAKRVGVAFGIYALALGLDSPVQASSKSCRTHKACRNSGLCTSTDDGCIAAKRSDCLKSKACREHGRCTAKDGICQLESDQDCKDSGICKRDGNCRVGLPWATKNSPPVPQDDPSLRVCGAGNKVACQLSEACKSRGACSPSETAFRKGSPWLVFRCAPASNRDCRRSKACSNYGHCSYDKATRSCALMSSKDCRLGSACKTAGACRFDSATATCVPGSSDDCKKTTNCTWDGTCTYDQEIGRCIIGSTADCMGSEACSRSGKCTFDPARFACKIGSSADCRKSPACKQHGRCSYDPKSKDAWPCSATTEGDCLASAECDDAAHYGNRAGGVSGVYRVSRARCSLDKTNKRCAVKSDLDCQMTPATQVKPHGSRFDAKTGACVKKTAKDCAKSDLCRDQGHCSLCSPSMTCCAKSTADCKTACRKSGSCAVTDNECHPAKDADCAQSDGCKEGGNCSFDPRGRCVNKDTVDCKRSANCKKLGNCARAVETSRFGTWAVCLPQTMNDCKTSTNCKQAGACGHHAMVSGYNNFQTCAPRNNRDCRRSLRCRKFGECTRWQPDTSWYNSLSMGLKTGYTLHFWLSVAPRCSARKQQDCRSSTMCKTHGWCTLVQTKGADRKCLPVVANKAIAPCVEVKWSPALGEHVAGHAISKEKFIVDWLGRCPRRVGK